MTPVSPRKVEGEVVCAEFKAKKFHARTEESAGSGVRVSVVEHHCYMVVQLHDIQGGEPNAHGRGRCIE